MLFNSFEFLILFLPVTLAGYSLLARIHIDAAAAWLTLASLFFYGWWDVRYVPLLLGSTAFNFLAGIAILQTQGRQRKLLLACAIAVNLGVLAYYKYANFFLGTARDVAGVQLPILAIVLPIGISFFTFTQIAFLVDSFRGHVREVHPIRYALFVTYFPHLIAGPVLHHAEMMPQFAMRETYRIQWDRFAAGSTVFVLGLAKKVIIADSLAPYASAVFDSPIPPRFLEAWGATLAYTFQLYFDFSGYTDMAIGLALLFGVKLPINFRSPYKALSVVDFWRRWHMTLSRFLRDYLYVPLGGNRRGTARRYVNLMLTMVLGGLWHGASWTFAFWGLLHGLYLVVNHIWTHFRTSIFGRWHLETRAWYSAVSWTICFLAVAVAWVFFRSPTFRHAQDILQGMVGLNGITLPRALDRFVDFQSFGIRSGTDRFVWPEQAVWLGLAATLCFCAPNTMEIIAYDDRLDRAISPPSRPLWQVNGYWAVFLAALLVACMLNLTRPSEFLYFQF